ncbi:MAG TPA: hypothetical protein VEX62_02280 [Candidatus Limnocylindrales bacterium]|nr:hypothetical protein [Candidatus Limnocylindrales bacterium]
MSNVVLWAAGAAMLAFAIWRIRAPFARMSELDRLAENARRYDSWRGARGPAADETTGADIMRQMLRRQVLIWAAVAIIGVVLIVAGFVIR